MSEERDNIIDIQFFDAALSDDEPDMPGLSVLIKRVNDGWLAVEVVFTIGFMPEDGSKLIEGQVVHVEVADKLQHIALIGESSHGFEHDAKSSEALHIALLRLPRFSVIKFDELDNCVPKAVSIGHGSDAEFRFLVDERPGESGKTTVMREAPDRETGAF